MVRTSLAATVAALVGVLAIAAFVMLAVPGGMVVVAILLSKPDANILQAGPLLLRGLILIAPLSMVLLPALTVVLKGRQKDLQWLLPPAGFVAGQWWGRLIAPLLYSETDRVTGLFGVLAGIGGLFAAIIFVRLLRRNG